jgi:hypothetical protein
MGLYISRANKCKNVFNLTVIFYKYLISNYRSFYIVISAKAGHEVKLFSGGFKKLVFPDAGSSPA